MPRRTRAEIEDALSRGDALRWGGETRQETIHLKAPEQQRLYKFLLGSPVRSATNLSAEFIAGLANAFYAAEPGEALAVAQPQALHAGPWRLKTIETDGFGGINVFDGPPFKHEFLSESVALDGENGSGKSSLIGALTWGFGGQRFREASPSMNPLARSQVFKADGGIAGSWPSIACYPPKIGQLIAEPTVRVKVTLAQPDETEATIERVLAGGVVTHTVDPKLDLPPILIETGIMMPARLAHLRLGGGENTLSDAVRMLTGLDEVAELGVFISDLCHGSKEYLKYAKSQDRDVHHGEFQQAIRRVETALKSIGQTCAAFSPSETRSKESAMALLGKKVSASSTAATQLIAADLEPTLDLTQVTVQQKIAAAIGAAKQDVAEGLGSLAPWKTIVAIAGAMDIAARLRLQQAVETARTSLNEALALRDKALSDSRFQLKALGAAWHHEHGADAIDACPLCEQSLRDCLGLATELAGLRDAGEAAGRTFKDNLSVIRQRLEEALPTQMVRSRQEVLALVPQAHCAAAIRDRWVTPERYSAYLTGVAQIVIGALANPSGDELADKAAITVKEAGAEALQASMEYSEHLLRLATWCDDNVAAWKTWWEHLTVVVPEVAETGKLTAKLDQLELAVRDSAPYREAALGLSDAWRIGRRVDQIDIEQARRKEIVELLEPLKSLNKLAEAETAGAIKGLSGRMEKMLDAIYVSERLKFSSAHHTKREGLIVRSSFSDEFRIDATLVANASWMRALLWAFLFSLRDEAIEQLKEDTLPLLVLDDPQMTFDHSHRVRWIEQIIAMQRRPTGVQVVLATHDESFIDQMRMHDFVGRSGHLSTAAPDIGNLLVTDGTAAARAWTVAEASKSGEDSRSYIEKSRVHLEAMFKVMLRGEKGTRTMTIGDLFKRIEQLNEDGNTPWDRAVFVDLINSIRGKKEMKILDDSHHTTGRTHGYTEAALVHAWLPKIEKKLDAAFLQIREYRLLFGESKALHASPAVIPFPAGHRAIVRKIPLAVIGRAAALTNGRAAADGAMDFVHDIEAFQPMFLGNHDAFRLVTPTLEPVARVGDVLLVAGHGEVPPGSLVIATCSNYLLARRYQLASEHSNVAVLSAQATSPEALLPPVVAHRSTVDLRKVVGVLFDPHTFTPQTDRDIEVVDCGGDAAINQLTKQSLGLVQVSGRSAEPQALAGQFLIVGDQISAEIACSTLDGRPVLAADSDGYHYFKRLRATRKTIVLESLHSGGEYPPVILAMPGSDETTLASVRPVLGVLFERCST